MKKVICAVVLIIFSVQFISVPIVAQDIVTSEEITFGSSVFILRSSNKSQKKFTSSGISKVSRKTSTRRVRQQIAYNAQTKGGNKLRTNPTEARTDSRINSTANAKGKGFA